jgi:hypothetical protein
LSGTNSLYHQNCKFIFAGGSCPRSLKPDLKNYSLDPVFENFRPVSNLSFLSKITEKAAANQLLNYCEKHAPLPICQSGFRKYHSTETALLKVQSDFLLSTDRQEVCFLVLLDLSSAFDTIDHKTVTDVLEYQFGVTDRALESAGLFHRSRVTGHGSQVTGHRSRVTGHGSQVSVYSHCTHENVYFIYPWQNNRAILIIYIGSPRTL